MGQSKIKSIKPMGTYKSQNGLMYKFDIELENGESGEVSAKTEDRWSIGDEVEYETTQTKWGVRMKLSKAGYNGNRGTQSPEVQKRIDACWAIALAIQEENDPEKIIEAAEHLINLRNTLISKL